MIDVRSARDGEFFCYQGRMQDFGRSDKSRDLENGYFIFPIN